MNLRRRVLQSGALALLTTLGACASVAPAPEVVLVAKGGITFRGKKLQNMDEFGRAIVDNKITAIDIHPQPGAGFEEIGRVIYGAVRHGARVERVLPMDQD